MSPKKLNNDHSTRNFRIDEILLLCLRNIKQQVIDGEKSQRNYWKQDGKDEEVAIWPESCLSDPKNWYNIFEFRSFRSNRDNGWNKSNQKSYAYNEGHKISLCCIGVLHVRTDQRQVNSEIAQYKQDAHKEHQKKENRNVNVSGKRWNQVGSYNYYQADRHHKSKWNDNRNICFHNREEGMPNRGILKTPFNFLGCHFSVSPRKDGKEYDCGNEDQVENTADTISTRSLFNGAIAALCGCAII